MSDNPYGPDPLGLTPQARAFYDRHRFTREDLLGTPVVESTTPDAPEPSWIKQAAIEGQKAPFELAGFKVIGDPAIKPGDIVVFGLGGIKHGRPSDYGYVEVVGTRPLRQVVRSFLARLADSVRGRK